MKSIRLAILLLFVLTVAIYSCSDDNSPGGKSSNTGGNNNTGGCAGGPMTVTDIDGNVYNVVSIGNQCWMKENLKTTHYKNGAIIPQWNFSTITGVCCDYNDFPPNANVYGKLYNGYAVVNPNGLCPIGWHVPTDSDWNQLVKSIDANADTACSSCSQSSIAGGALKEIGLTHWASPNVGATDSVGFLGLPGGWHDTGQTYGGIFIIGKWWTASQATGYSLYERDIYSGDPSILKGENDMSLGLSVRCVRD